MTTGGVKAGTRSGEAFTRTWAEVRAGLDLRVPGNEIVVESGDTLSTIVRDMLQRRDGTPPDLARTMATVRRVAEANGIINPDRIYPGQRITITDAVLSADRAAPVAIEAARSQSALGSL